MLKLLGGAPQPQDGGPLGLVTAAGLSRSSRPCCSSAGNVERASAFWWSARAAFITPRGLDNTVDKGDTLLRFSLSRTLEATIHQHDVQTCSHPHGSDQDETQLHSVCSRALETTIHQIDIVTFSQPQLDHQTNSALHGVDAMKTGQSWRVKSCELSSEQVSTRTRVRRTTWRVKSWLLEQVPTLTTLSTSTCQQISAHCCLPTVSLHVPASMRHPASQSTVSSVPQA